MARSCGPEELAEAAKICKKPFRVREWAVTISRGLFPKGVRLTDLARTGQVVPERQYWTGIDIDERNTVARRSD
ncbi:MAG: hypothetical protein CMJ47_00590 [Planctomyces sp.]|nr:hypothetical protein [Planctomyces sp.]